jgi:hypothetical protein
VHKSDPTELQQAITEQALSWKWKNFDFSFWTDGSLLENGYAGAACVSFQMDNHPCKCCQHNDETTILAHPVGFTWQDLHNDDKTCMQSSYWELILKKWTMTRMLDYWWVMCFTSYWLNWNSWIWILFPIDSDCALLCTQVDKTRYSSIASGNNCIVQLCKCVSLHL